MSEPVGLGALFLSSFLAATLLPGGSEIVLGAVLLNEAVAFWPALLVATLGNTLGGLSTYLIGRFVPEKSRNRNTLSWLRRYGSPALLLSWLPVLGDALCLAAGWLRINAWRAAAFIAAGKFVRYWVVAEAVSRSL